MAAKSNYEKRNKKPQSEQSPSIEESKEVFLVPEPQRVPVKESTAPAEKIASDKDPAAFEKSELPPQKREPEMEYYYKDDFDEQVFTPASPKELPLAPKKQRDTLAKSRGGCCIII